MIERYLIFQVNTVVAVIVTLLTVTFTVLALWQEPITAAAAAGVVISGLLVYFIQTHCPSCSYFGKGLCTGFYTIQGVVITMQK